MTANYDLGKQNSHNITKYESPCLEAVKLLTVMNKRVHFSNIIFVPVCRFCLSKRL